MKFADVISEKIYNISNFLSITRVLLLAPFIYCSFQYVANPSRLGLGLLYLITLGAVITDYLDGYLARRLNQETMMGRYLDPVCDKIVTVTALGLLVYDYGFPLWLFLFYLIREIAGVWGGTFLFFKRDVQGSPNIFGKLGVGVVALAVIWYMSVPYVRTIREPEDFLLQPDYSAYALGILLVLGIIAYWFKYGPLIFFNDKAKKNDDGGDSPPHSNSAA